MSKHTPGPWLVGSWGGQCKKVHSGTRYHPGKGGDDPCVYEPVFYADICEIACASGGMVVTTEYDELRIKPEDALLIAAAPDLLEACEAHIAALGTKIRDGKDRPEYREAIYQAYTKMVGAIAKARGGL